MQIFTKFLREVFMVYLNGIGKLAIIHYFCNVLWFRYD